MNKLWFAPLLVLLIVQCKKENSSSSSGLFTSDTTNKTTFDSITIPEAEAIDSTGLPSQNLPDLNAIANTTPEQISSPANVPTNSKPASLPYAFIQNQEGAYQFFYRLEPSKTYNLNVRIKNTQTATVQGQSEKVVDTETRKISFTVVGLNQGVYDINVKFKELGQNSTLPDGTKMSLNTSAGRPSDEMLKMPYDIRKAQVNAGSFSIKMTQLGQIVGISGLDKMRSAVRNKIKPQLKNDQEIKFFDQLLAQSLSDQIMVIQLSELLMEFKPEALKTNGKWSDSQSINENGMSGKIDVSVALNQVNTDKIQFKLNGKQNLSGSITKEGITEKVNRNSTLSGSRVLDASSGWPKRASITNRSKSTTTLSKEGESLTQTITEVKETTIS